MTLFVYIYVLSCIAVGIYALSLYVCNSVLYRNVSTVILGNENDTEFNIRWALFTYPYATVYVPRTEISDIFIKDTTRVKLNLQY